MYIDNFMALMDEFGFKDMSAVRGVPYKHPTFGLNIANKFYEGVEYISADLFVAFSEGEVVLYMVRRGPTLKFIGTTFDAFALKDWILGNTQLDNGIQEPVATV